MCCAGKSSTACSNRRRASPQALADGIGVTTGELRALANQGALTTEVVIQALQRPERHAFNASSTHCPPPLAEPSRTCRPPGPRTSPGPTPPRVPAAPPPAPSTSWPTTSDTLGAVLFSAGKAAAAFAAFRLAQSFVETRAAVAAATVAVAANNRRPRQPTPRPRLRTPSLLRALWPQRAASPGCCRRSRRSRSSAC